MRRAATVRQRLRALGGVLLVAIVVVGVAVAISSGRSAGANAASGGRLIGVSESSSLFAGIPLIGPDSVSAGRAASAAAQQNKLWNFIDLMYLNQGQENTGYPTPSYLRRLLEAVPGLDVPAALNASRAPSADAALTQANNLASQDRINATPSFLIGKAGGTQRQFQPPALTAAPFAATLNELLGASR